MSYNDDYNNRNNSENYPFYEDTHRQDDDFSKMSNNFQNENVYNQSAFTQPQPQPIVQKQEKEVKNFKNLVVYHPKTETDSQVIIDFLKKKEPAIVSFDKASPEAAQRILDFVSGAVYALSGTVHRVSGNIFLLTPKNVEVTIPYEVNND